MNYFDIIIIVPILWGAYKGFRKGLIIELVSIAALVLGIIGGIKFSDFVAEKLNQYFEISETLLPVISFSLTFIVIVVIVFSGGKLIEKTIKMAALSTVNRIFGAVFGMLKFALVLSALIHLVNKVDKHFSFIKPEMKANSLLYKPVEKVLPTLLPVFEDVKEKI
ncbi:MAG: hypothetical protein Kow0079_01230 [Vicingaceae bacterium]